MAEPAHKPIAALASIDNDAILDTGPSAYHAVWSPDSRHVAVHFRSDRHVLTMLLYEIRDGRPHLTDTPSLFGAATKLPDTSDDFEIRSDVTYLTWLSPTTFALKEQRTLEIKAPGLPKNLGPTASLTTTRPAAAPAISRRGISSNFPQKPPARWCRDAAIASSTSSPARSSDRRCLTNCAALCDTGNGRPRRPERLA